MSSSKQKRIVLNPNCVEKAERILEATGIDNCSQLMSILVNCFGEELVRRMKGEIV